MLSPSEKNTLKTRLRRIEGQVAGIQRMLEADAYCVDVLHQIAAAQGALGQVSRIVLARHIETCVADVFRHGKATERRTKIEELVNIFAHYK